MNLHAHEFGQDFPAHLHNELQGILSGPKKYIMVFLLIDLLQPVKEGWLGLEWNQYSIYFVGVMGVIIAGLVLVKKVEEPKAARLEEFVLDLIRNSPLRSWLRE